MSMSTLQNQRRVDGVYFFSIEGLPKKYTWQDLKDLLRSQASRIAWTEIAVMAKNQPSSTGTARVSKIEEANKVYKFLTEKPIEGKRLRVCMFDVTETPAQFMRSNYDFKLQPSGAQIYQMAAQQGWQTLGSPMMPQPSPYQTPVSQPPAPIMPTAQPPQSLSQEEMVQMMMSLNLDPRDQSHTAWIRQNWQRCMPRLAMAAQQQAQYQQQQQQAVRSPMYTLNSAGAPVNTVRGVVRTESRGVFVSGLNFKATQDAIAGNFNKAGKIVRCDLQKDSSGKSKGNAIIKYTSVDEAQHAIDMFHGKIFQNMTLNVRFDRDRTPINAPAGTQPARGGNGNEPIIVNGSQVRQAA